MGIARFVRRKAHAHSGLGALTVTSLAALAGCLGAPAYASAKPVITELKAAPSSVAGGSPVTVSAAVSEATECTISANKAVAGLPVSFSCESGSVDREVVMPQNSGEKALKYKLKLAAAGASGVARAKVSVTVTHTEPEPVFTDAGYHFQNVLGECATETGHVLISGDGTSAVWGDCTYRFEGGVWVPAALLPERGVPLAMSRDGLTLVMAYEGARVEVFTRASEAEEWAPQATLTVNSEYFGVPKVAISADGDRLLMGGERENGLKTSPERPPREFDRSGEAWSEGEAPSVGTLRCHSVALSNDGDTALLGCTEVQSGKLVGSPVLPFVRSGSSWVQQGPALKGSGLKATEEFSGRMAISASGDTAIFGGAYNLKGKGEAWVFQRNGEIWAQQGPPLEQPEKKNFSKLLGAGVALSADGNLALVGAPGIEEAANPESREIGSVYVFGRTGESWSFEQRIKSPKNQGGDELGRFMALSESGAAALFTRPCQCTEGSVYSLLEIFSQ